MPTTFEIAALYPEIVPNRIVTCLADPEIEIKTLADIRRLGGVPPLSDEDPQTLARLEAHAYLNLVHEDSQDNDKLIKHFIPEDLKAGETCIQGSAILADIARAPRADFVRWAGAAGVDEQEAEEIRAELEAAGVAVNVHPVYRYLPASGRDTQVLALMAAVCRPAGDHDVSLGDLVLNGHPAIREGGVRHSNVLFEPLWAGRQTGRAAVSHVVWLEDVVDGGQVTPVPHLFKEAAHEGLVLL